MAFVVLKSVRIFDALGDLLHCTVLMYTEMRPCVCCCMLTSLTAGVS